jgi:opacity protein-like surface antigen
VKKLPCIFIFRKRGFFSTDFESLSEKILQAFSIPSLPKKNNYKSMKKTFSILAIASALALSSQANAKTEGNYLGLDVIRSSAKVKSSSSLASDNAGNGAAYYSHNKKDSSYGVGVNYKYAFNFNNFFIAPGVSYDLLNNDVKAGFAGRAGDPYSQSMKLKSRLTLQANLGYDITDQFAAYIPVGISSFGYELNTNDNDGAGTVRRTKKTGSESAGFIGLGFSYEPVKNWVVNLEYNRFQSIKVSSATATSAGGRINTKTDIDMAKLGLAYRF